ncbi:hypothetical protein [Ruegeria faecimaris]|uniref:hypothetical protein n=1 Tax=Ruegeria faecimaris TaxID=686389 RepID=UPI00248F6830|nr:hypothetical protein [Ruegeria faecimaris]
MSKSRVKPRYFAIALLPVCVFAIHKLIQNQMIANELDVPVNFVLSGSSWQEAVGRFRFLAASWFFLSLALLPVAVLFRTLSRPIEKNTRIAAIAIVVAIVFLALVPTIQKHMTDQSPQIYHQIGKAVFETALSQGTLPACSGSEDSWMFGKCGQAPVLSLFNRILDLVNAMAGLAIGSLIVGMILCLGRHESQDIEATAAELAQNLRQMRQQLYLSSLVLTFGMFFAASWMYWPLPMIAESERAAYSALLNASALFTGTYFCLLMLSYFLPVAVLLDGRISNLALAARNQGGTDQTFDIDDWRSSHKLTEGTGDIIRAGFALTAPILAAFAGGISPILG